MKIGPAYDRHMSGRSSHSGFRAGMHLSERNAYLNRARGASTAVRKMLIEYARHAHHRYLFELGALK